MFQANQEEEKGFNRELSARIQILRKDFNLSREDFAQATGLTLQEVREAERDGSTVDIPMIKCIMDAYDVYADYLLLGITPMFRPDHVTFQHIEALLNTLEDDQKVYLWNIDSNVSVVSRFVSTITEVPRLYLCVLYTIIRELKTYLAWEDLCDAKVREILAAPAQSPSTKL